MRNALRRLGYSQTRRLLLAAGVLALLLIVGVMYVRRVETVEVMATILFIPIFVAFVFGDMRGGLVAGGLAAIAYAGLRYPAIRAVGTEAFAGLIASRSVGYLLFGAVGGVANRQLKSSLFKLDLYDQVDDATGLFNARFFVQDTDLEMARSRRYQTIFSVTVIDVPAAAFEGLHKRQAASVLRELGRMMSHSVRTVDRAVHGRDDLRHRLAVVLPETGPEGARVFLDRTADRVTDFLAQRGARVDPDEVGRSAATFPGDEVAIEAFQAEFREIDRREHPEVSEPTLATAGGGGTPAA